MEGSRCNHLEIAKSNAAWSSRSDAVSGQVNGERHPSAVMSSPSPFPERDPQHLSAPHCASRRDVSADQPPRRYLSLSYNYNRHRVPCIAGLYRQPWPEGVVYIRSHRVSVNLHNITASHRSTPSHGVSAKTKPYISACSYLINGAEWQLSIVLCSHELPPTPRLNRPTASNYTNQTIRLAALC